jgi:secondary thiamine-phosphate synthase enzyme
MVVTERISLGTRGRTEIVDITGEVASKVASSKMKRGTVTVFIAGSTAGLTTIEYESGLVADFRALWDRIAPDGIPYAHNERWGDGNGYAHIRASLLGSSLTVPFVDRRLTLGTWQQIVLVDFDNRARQRQIILQLIGE